MNLELSEDQKLLQEAVDKFFRQESTPECVRKAEPLGYDAALWEGVVGMGLPLMRVSSALGGGELSLLDAVIIAEIAGHHLASVSLNENVVAAQLLASVGGEIAEEWLESLASGTKQLSVALQSVEDGANQLVPGGAIVDAVLCLDGDSLYLVSTESRSDAIEGHSVPVARWQLDQNRTPLANGEAAIKAYKTALEEWKLLTAATMSGLARASLEQASAYACERHAFGQPIGSFQGLAHPLADAVTDVDGGYLVIWQAVSMLAKGEPEAAALISLSYWWMAKAAQNATIKAMRAFGGYGMTMEYDAQLYFRRVRAFALMTGDPDKELGVAGDRLFGYAGDTPVPETGEIGIDFDYGDGARAAAAKAEKFLKENLTDELREFSAHSMDGYHPEFLKKLAAAGLMFPDWSKEFGGPELGAYECVAIQGVLADHDWLFSLIGVSDIISKILMIFASPEVKSEVLPKIASADAFLAMGYTEPSCGSDVFAAKTKAVKDGDDWIIDGQKMFTSQGHIADYVLVLARTNPDVAKHKGLSLFLVPTDVEGYECHQVETVHDERTNVTYYSGIRVSDKYRIGDVDGGVKVMAAALALEQGGNAYFAHCLRQVYTHGKSWALDAGNSGAAIERAEVRSRLAKVYAYTRITDALTDRAIWAAEENCGKKSYGPMTKLFSTEAWITCTSEIMELAAPDVLFCENNSLGRIELEHRRSIASTIWGGASEVQRSTIAEDALGLPKTRS